MQGKMWRVIKECMSAVLLEGEKSEVFNVEQGVAQGCSLSPILFCVFINGLLVVVEQAGLGTELSDRGKLEGCCLQIKLWGLVSRGNSYRCGTILLLQARVQ